MKKLLIACVALLLPLTVQAADKSTTMLRHLDVTGEGRLHVKPDKADIQFTVHKEHKLLKTVKQQADDKLKEVLPMLQALGIAEGDIQTQYASIMPRYRYVSSSVIGAESGKQVFETYEANYAIVVTVKKLDVVGAVLQKLNDAGIDQVGNVSYGLVDERPIKERALTEAIAVARRKADIAAKAMNVRIGGVISFTESGAQFTPMPVLAAAPMMTKMAMADASAPVPSAPPAGDIEVTQAVNISYGIGD